MLFQSRMPYLQGKIKKVLISKDFKKLRMKGLEPKQYRLEMA